MQQLVFARKKLGVTLNCHFLECGFRTAKMNALCGWAGLAPADLDANVALDKMAEALGISSERGNVGSSSWATVAVLGEGDTARRLHSTDRTQLVCTGTPRFKNPELVDIAARDGPAAAIAGAYERAGIQCLQGIQGPFALAICDRATGRTVLAIDRAGIVPLFFCLAGEGIVFASAARSLNGHPAVRRPVDPQSIFNYLYFHVVPSPRGIYQGHERLLPGEYVVWDRGSVRRSFYWQPRYIENGGGDERELALEFKQLLRDSVVRAAGEVRKKGAFLSGGTDSSTVAGLMTEIQDGPVDAYSVGFGVEGYDEMRFARVAAAHFGLHHHEYYLTPDDVVQAIPRLVRAYDGPFGNASAVAAYYCARMAAQDGVECLLAGDGGDELFAGNERYATQRIFELYLKLPSSLRKAAIEPFVFSFPGGRNIPPIRKLQSYVRQACIPLPDRLETYNHLNETSVEEILHPDFLAAIDPEEPIELLRTVYGRAQAVSSLNRMLYLDLKQTLADNDLSKVSQACETAGIRVAYPLLDEELIELSTRIPVRQKLKGAELRYFFKMALRDFLPKEILKKKKHGFGVPCGIWIRSHQPLRELAYESLSSLRDRGFLNRSYVERLIDLHKNVHAPYYGVMIWVLLMLEQWLEAEGKG